MLERFLCSKLKDIKYCTQLYEQKMINQIELWKLTVFFAISFFFSCTFCITACLHCASDSYMHLIVYPKGYKSKCYKRMMK